ncbi:DUF317 domain-containing protein [Streptomyces sp. KL116D]|uniref:DUF317 domain-containing protein n=1 Tax=Streptomyces sp. KL116D TaxID=3045152 RepID=UPI0035564240
MLDLVDAREWAIVDTPGANVHATSPDGCLRRLAPKGSSAWQRSIVRHVRVQPADGNARVQEFRLHTHSEVIARFLATLVTDSSC